VRAFKNAVVIPVRAESEYLPHTLESLANNPVSALADTLVILVINNPPPVGHGGSLNFAENQETLRLLRNSHHPFQKELDLSWIDASIPGFEINPKEGVGTARKIGMDTALSFLDFTGICPIIISLDADTRVERNYLSSIRSYFKANPDKAGATINFEHQAGSTPEEDAAVVSYELFMRYYVEGLRISQSPYAHHVLGSAMAFRAEDYVRAGGMRRRNGGEDFYFMQAIRKIGAVGQITETVVHPSSRASDRVPFGTGPRISQIVESGRGLMFYNPEIFLILKKLFASVDMASATGHASFQEVLYGIDASLTAFLIENNFFHEWEKILNNTPKDKKKIHWAFHTWFDAFRTLKFVHFCEDRYPETGLMDAYMRLFGKSDTVLPETAKTSERKLLEFMRKRN
jgi:glycosyltransferase involved in cell wall biosynthesis